MMEPAIILSTAKKLNINIHELTAKKASEAFDSPIEKWALNKS